jgi:DNA-binding NarL/FixJ family response regulator
MVAKKPIRVVVASDQPIYLRGLTALVLSIENARLVGEARTIVETMQLCQMSEPEMVILDLKDAPQQGRQLAHQIIETWPGTRVVVMLAPQDEATGPEDNPGGPVYTFSRDVGEDEFKNAVSQLWQDSNDKARNPAASARAGKASDDELVDVSQITRRGGQSRNEKVIARELVMAGKIQADILPEGAPAIPGWDISARLEPARETSGDFYDFIPLSDRKLGIVVADVTDKGMGAALFMALSSTLIRTYASRFPTLPAFALSAVNERILTDTRGSMFVTAIFAILEPHTGRLVFANAGHPPGYILSGRRGHE